MDKCQFSEFSYGYCLTEDLIVGQGSALTAAPVFPSLIQEGQPGYGYDVLLERPGTPLFLQFKLVHQMVRSNANEAKLGDFQAPFYRMHLRPGSISDQHASLLALEQAGNDVFYVAPSFHTIGALNTNYAQRQVWDRSFKVTPLAIGPVDLELHHISFSGANGTWKLYSDESTRQGHGRSSSDIELTLEKRIDQRGRRSLRDQVAELDQNLLEIVNERNPRRSRQERVAVEELGEGASPTRRAAYIARQFFDCQLMFVTRR